MLQNASIITANGKSCATVFVPGADEPILTADDTHPNFERIVAVIIDPQGATPAEVADLFDAERAAVANFARTSVSERISVKDGQVFFDNTPVDTSLTKQMVRLMDEGVSDWEGLALFMEKVETNPNDHSKEQLYEWLRRHDVAINAEGDCIFYKGVRKNDDGTLVSVNRGPAIVDGVEVNGAVPNEVGSVVEMDRTMVKHDPKVGCASGLHVANWRYANSWAQGAVLKVLVNPRDVVSVPTDSSFEKVRCSRYKVIEVVDAPYSTAYLPEDGIDTGEYPGSPADFDLDVSGGAGIAAVGRMGARYSTPAATVRTRPLGAHTGRMSASRPNLSQVPSARTHGRGGRTSQTAKGSGRNPAQDAKGRFSAGRPSAKRNAKGQFAG
jgi:hypothetical protein